jgi:hypothetical protein
MTAEPGKNAALFDEEEWLKANLQEGKDDDHGECI